MNKRCSYIPPEGQSVIAIAKERGGTTEGDIAALVDRFGCKAEAAFEIAIGDADEPDELIDACRDHVGHLLGDGGCWVHSIEPIENPFADGGAWTGYVPAGIARAGFGPAIILSQSPAAPPVVDLGDNPTREQLEAAGLSAVSASYREARAAFGDRLTNAVRRAMVQLMADGALIPANADGYRLVRVTIAKALGVSWDTVEVEPQPPGFRVTWNGVGALWPEAPAAAAFTPISLPTTQTVGVARPGLVLQSGDKQIMLHPTSVTPDFDGSSATLRIVAPMDDSQFTALENLHRARALLHVDGGGPYAMVERSYAASKTSEAQTMTLVLKQIQIARSAVNAVPGAYRL